MLYNTGGYSKTIATLRRSRRRQQWLNSDGNPFRANDISRPQVIMSSTDVFDSSKYLDCRGIFTGANPVYDCPTEHIMPKLMCSPAAALPTPPSLCDPKDSPPDLEVDAVLRFLTTDLVKPSAKISEVVEPATTSNPEEMGSSEQEDVRPFDSPTSMSSKKRSRFSLQSLVSKKTGTRSKEPLVTCVDEEKEVSDGTLKNSSDNLDSYNTSPNDSGIFSNSSGFADSATSHEIDAPPVPAMPSKSVQDRAQTFRKQLQAPSKFADKVTEACKTYSNDPKGQLESKSSQSLKRKSKRQSYNDHRLSIFSVASSMAALAPFIGIKSSEDTKPIIETSPDCVDSEVESLYNRFNNIEEPQPEKKKAKQRRKSSILMKTVPEYAPGPVVKPPDTSAAFVSNVVQNLSQELDERFNCVDADLKTSPEFDWKPQLPEKAEHRSHLRRLLGWCKNHRLHLSKGSREHRAGHFWNYSLRGSQTAPRSGAVPFNIQLETPPILECLALGDMGSPPMSLRAQTEPAMMAQNSL